MKHKKQAQNRNKHIQNPNISTIPKIMSRIQQIQFFWTLDAMRIPTIYRRKHTSRQCKQIYTGWPRNARPPESGRTQIWDARPDPSVRIRPNSDLGRPPESGRTLIGDDRPNPAEKQIKHDRNQNFGLILHVLGSKFGF